MKIIYDKEVLANGIKPNINLALGNIKEALNIANSLNIPINFSRKSDIENLKNSLLTIQKDLNKYNMWIDNVIASISRNDELIQNDISKINIVDVTKIDYII